MARDTNPVSTALLTIGAVAATSLTSLLIERFALSSAMIWSIGAIATALLVSALYRPMRE